MPVKVIPAKQESLTEIEKYLIAPVPTAKDFNVKIRSINETGYTKVSFSSEIVPAINLDTLNNKEEEIIVVKYWSAKLQGYDDLAIENWKVVNLTSKRMNIQINFTDPDIVSML